MYGKRHLVGEMFNLYNCLEFKLGGQVYLNLNIEAYPF